MGTRSLTVSASTVSATLSDIAPRRRLTLPLATSRGIFCSVLAAAAAAGACAADPHQTAQAIAQAGPSWAHLLRAMAGLKTLMALAAAAAVLWRLHAPTSLARLASYSTAAAAMMAGPGLIWGLVHIALGALLLHAGLAATLVVLWRDPQIPARLAILVANGRRPAAPPLDPARLSGSQHP